jgi:hypothetical protein
VSRWTSVLSVLRARGRCTLSRRPPSTTEPGAPALTLATLGALTDLGLATENVASHVSAKVLLDAYLDLFEGCLPPLARLYIPLRGWRDPNRVPPTGLLGESARTLFERMAKGREWSSLLVPFDPFYRNGIAHRSTRISPDGSVVVRDENGDDRYLSWPHLVALVQDALAVIHPLVAALDLTPSKMPTLSVNSLPARERVGFHLLTLEQALDSWEPTPYGMVTVRVRGRRCDEAELLSVLVRSFASLEPRPKSLFIDFRNTAGEPRGYWSVDGELVALAEESIDGVQAAVRKSKSYQLRFQ